MEGFLNRIYEAAARTAPKLAFTGSLMTLGGITTEAIENAEFTSTAKRTTLEHVLNTGGIVRDAINGVSLIELSEEAEDWHKIANVLLVPVVLTGTAGGFKHANDLKKESEELGVTLGGTAYDAATAVSSAAYVLGSIGNTAFLQTLGYSGYALSLTVQNILSTHADVTQQNVKQNPENTEKETPFLKALAQTFKDHKALGLTTLSTAGIAAYLGTQNSTSSKQGIEKLNVLLGASYAATSAVTAHEKHKKLGTENSEALRNKNAFGAGRGFSGLGIGDNPPWQH